MTTTNQHHSNTLKSNKNYHQIQNTTNTPTFSNIGNKTSNTWRICTLNTHDLNSPGKSDNVLQLFNYHQIDILCLTETKLKNRSAKFSFPKSNQYHHIFTTNDQHPFGSGISILIKQEWAKHIQKVYSINGRLIHLMLAFSGNIIIHILACYFPASLLSNNKQIKKKMLQKINSTLTLSDYCIILGDFNEHFFEPPKNGITDLLTFKGFYETVYTIYPQRDDPTWKRQNANRRLDMIWCSPKLATLLIHAAISDPQWIITDHLSVFCDLSSTSITHHTPTHILKKWKTKRYAFITQNLPEETWQKYHDLTEILSTTSSASSTNNVNTL